MKVRLIRDFRGLHAGRIVDAGDEAAEVWIAQGIAEAIEPEPAESKAIEAPLHDKAVKAPRKRK